MKHLFTILLGCVCFVFHATAQELNQYKYSYKFQLEKLNDSSIFEIDTFTNRKDITTIIKGKIKDSKEKKALNALTIVLKNTDTIITCTTNKKGRFKIIVNPSNYDLRVSGVGYKTMHQSISLVKQNIYNCKILLAVESVSDWYNIHSIKELTNDEIEEIKKCVKDNNGKVSKCLEKSKYYITIEI